MCVCVCVYVMCTENYGECDDISVGVTGTKPHLLVGMCVEWKSLSPDRRHMTAFLFANQTDHFHHVPSTVEKLPGKAISTTTHIHFTKGRGLVWLRPLKRHQNAR